MRVTSVGVRGLKNVCCLSSLSEFRSTYFTQQVTGDRIDCVIFAIMKQVFKFLRVSACKYQEFVVKTEILKFFIFSQKKPFGETFSKIIIKVSKEFSFSRKPAKSEMLPSHHIVAGPKPLNYTIFKALRKKSGSRKQVHL